MHCCVLHTYAVPPSPRGAQQSRWLPLAVKACFPHPQRYHRVWSIQTGSQPLFVWEPVPPSGQYAALGMVATLTDEPPSIDALACVHQATVPQLRRWFVSKKEKRSISHPSQRMPPLPRRGL